jgi:hypothetical protein
MLDNDGEAIMSKNVTLGAKEIAELDRMYREGGTAEHGFAPHSLPGAGVSASGMRPSDGMD